MSRRHALAGSKRDPRGWFSRDAQRRIAEICRTAPAEIPRPVPQEIRSVCAWCLSDPLVPPASLLDGSPLCARCAGTVSA